MFCSCFSASLVMQGPAGPLGSEYFSRALFYATVASPGMFAGLESCVSSMLRSTPMDTTRSPPLPDQDGLQHHVLRGSPPGEHEPAAERRAGRAVGPARPAGKGRRWTARPTCPLPGRDACRAAPSRPQVAPLRERASALRSLAEGLLLHDEHVHGMSRVLHKPREGVTMDCEDHVLIGFAICAERRPCQPIARARSSRTCLLLPTTVLLASELS